MSFTLANDPRNRFSTSQVVKANRFLLPTVNISPSVLNIILPPENETLGSMIFNVFNSQLYIISQSVSGAFFWSSSNSTSDYEVLKARYNTVVLRRALAMRATARPSLAIDELMPTTWTQGRVNWIITSTGSMINTTAIWNRIKNDTLYSHEFSLDMPPLNPIAIPSQFIEGVTLPSLPIDFVPVSAFSPTITPSGSITEWFQPYQNYLVWNNPTGPQTDGMQTATINVGATPNWFADLQSPAEAESLFFQRIFGVATQPFLVKNATSVTQNMSTISLSAANNFYPKEDENIGGPGDIGLLVFTQNVIPAVGEFVIEVGKILVRPDVPIDTSIDQNLYSLWRNSASEVNDRVLVPLPSTVLNATSTIVTTEIFNNLPHARIENLGFRNYVRPTTTNGVPFLNYCKLTSFVSSGFGFHRFTITPGSSVWYFWNPGETLWFCGPRAGNPANVYFIGPTGSRVFSTLGVGVILDAYIWQMPTPTAPLPQDFIMNPILGTQVLGNATLIGGVPDVIGNTLASILTGFSGQTLTGPDKIVFACFAGNPNPAWRTASPYQLRAHVENFQQAPDVSIFSVDEGDISLASNFFTQNSLDASTFTINASNTIPLIFDYGGFTFNAISVSGSTDPLFPPPYYLTINQGVTPDVLSLEARLLSLETSLTTFVGPAINSLIQSIDQIGITNELISQRIYKLDQGIRIRIDQLADAIVNVATALNNFIGFANVNFTDQFGDNLSGQFLSFLLTEGPMIVTAVASLVGLNANAINGAMFVFDKAFGTINDRYRAIYFEQNIGGLITKAIQFAQSGDQQSAVAYGIAGITMFDQLRQAFTINASGVGTINNQMLTLGTDGTPFLSPAIQQRLQSQDPGSDQRTLLTATTENVMTLTEEADNLLLQLNTLGAMLGIPPVSPYDVDIF